MTDRRWTSLCCIALTLALLAALPAAAAPGCTPAAAQAAAPDPAASYEAIFAPPADPVAAAPVETGFTITYCCSATYCCEPVMPSECDGVAFGSIFNCAMRCSLC